VEALWSCGVEGEYVESLIVEAERVLVSTGQQTLVVESGRGLVSRRKLTLVVGREGQLLGRDERLLLRPAAGRPSVPLGDSRYALEEGDLLRFDAHGALMSRTSIALDLIERHLEGVTRRGTYGWPDLENVWGDQTRWRWWTATLVADSERARLAVIGLVVPWLAALRTDGNIEWVRLGRRCFDCCNSAAVVANDGTLAHYSSCGSWIAFVSPEGDTLSSHDIGGFPSGLSTNRRGVAYVTDLEGRILAYRPETGLALILDVPHITHADVRDGILYAVTKHPSDGLVLMAFREPT
jgi:hypothetical protein